MDKHSSETIERFCHVIGKNTPVSKILHDGETVYECMNKHNCNGDCKNQKLCGDSRNKSKER